MNLANALQGGIAGATTLGLLEKALQNIDGKKPKMKLLNKPGIIKKLRKSSKKKGSHKMLIEVSKELLSAATYYGFIKLGKKKNALLTGALLGAATGAGVAFLESKSKRHKDDYSGGLNNELDGKPSSDFWNANRDAILTIGLYTAGGLLAGVAMKKVQKRIKKK
ncbi:hypothetical protein EXU57_19400 [Segetibacter sp. 3557_3]|uniref:hypothetical protein n=1 Tax=Segetibacter sp. 3557_3 TaxID=2547429 RepID=UPI001058A3B9|nr:hypothetical protein [Segetibacter sp. 3557_3]TDH21668.1 hypothetical protein EXU57_19400 [Segetibacter sp. 3557_3]